MNLSCKSLHACTFDPSSHCLDKTLAGNGVAAAAEIDTRNNERIRILLLSFILIVSALLVVKVGCC